MDCTEIYAGTGRGIKNNSVYSSKGLATAASIPRPTQDLSCSREVSWEREGLTTRVRSKDSGPQQRRVTIQRLDKYSCRILARAED